MEYSDRYLVLLIVGFFISNIIAEVTNDDQFTHDIQAYSKRKSQSPGLWFGPRLGRRKRNPAFDDNFPANSLERKQFEAIMDALQSYPWAVLAINGKYLPPILEGKRQTVNYIPRLGRESGELGDSEGWLQDPELTKELMSQRSPPFAPRLGRRKDSYDFDPRLGRHINGKL